MRHVNDIAVVALDGELDGHSADMVQGALGEWVRPECKIVLDLEKVPFLSSAGLRVLLSAYRDVEAQNGRIILTGVDQHIRDVMAATGFLQYFQFADDVTGGMGLLDTLQ